MAHGELVEMEASLDDQSEQAKIEQLLRDSCNCQLGPYAGPCSSAVSKEAIVPCQNNCLQMARKELNLAVMAQSYAPSTPAAHRSLSAHGQENFRPHAQMKFSYTSMPKIFCLLMPFREPASNQLWCYR